MEELKLIPLDLSVLSEELIEILLLDSTAEASLFNEIAQKNTHRPEILRHLLSHPQTPETTRQFVAQILEVPIPKVADAETTTETPTEEQTREFRVQSLFQRIQKMKIGEKIQLARRGSREIRSILIRDSNREVMLTVLENPKITESEVEILAKQRTSPDEVLRTIAKKREWLRNHLILYALITNPKTPTAIALRCMPALKLKDLLPLEKNKNVHGAVRAVAKKLIAARR
jgi:hypothetical protein